MDHHQEAVSGLQTLTSESSQLKIQSTIDKNECTLTLLGRIHPELYSMVSTTFGIDLQALLFFIEVIRFMDVKSIVNEDQRLLIEKTAELYHSWFNYARTTKLFENGLLKDEHLISLLISPERCFTDSQLFNKKSEEYTARVKARVKGMVEVGGATDHDLSMKTIGDKNVTALFLNTGPLLKMFPFLMWLKESYPDQNFLCCFWLQHQTQLTPAGKCELHIALRRTSPFIDLAKLPQTLGLTGGGHHAASGAQFLLDVKHRKLSPEFISGAKPLEVDQAVIREVAEEPLRELVKKMLRLL
jgi:hypothetical protein